MADDLGKLIGFIIGLPSIIALLFVVAAIPKISTDPAQNAANLTNYTGQVSQAIVEYSMPWWLPLLGLGTIGALVLIALVVVFGRRALDG